jgi:hypothetical protein
VSLGTKLTEKDPLKILTVKVNLRKISRTQETEKLQRTQKSELKKK